MNKSMFTTKGKKILNLEKRPWESQTLNTFYISLSKMKKGKAYLTYSITSTQDIRYDFLCDIAMPCIHKHPKVVKAKEHWQVLYIISYKKEQNLRVVAQYLMLLPTPIQQTLTQQEKLSSQGKYTNIALYKSQNTFASAISFDSLKKHKSPGQIWHLSYPIYRGKIWMKTKRLFAYIHSLHVQ